jgi:hypothetical protein
LADVTGATAIFNAFSAAVTKDSGQLKDVDQYKDAAYKLNDLVVAVLNLQSQAAGSLNTRAALSDFLTSVVRPLQDIVAKLPANSLDSRQLLDGLNTLGTSVNTAIKGETTRSGRVADLNVDATIGLAANLVTLLEGAPGSPLPGSDTLEKQALTAYLTNADTLAKHIVGEKKSTALKYSDFSDSLSKLSSDIFQLQDATRNIDVLGAWYGDVEVIGQALQYGGVNAWAPGPPGTRFCSATASVRSLCEGKSACFQPAVVTPPSDSSKAPVVGYLLGNPQGSATATYQITGSNLCGYEPAPYANSKVNGLVVAYQCKAMTQDAWKAQPDQHNGPADLNWITIKGLKSPGSGKAKDPTANGSELKVVLLRAGAIGEIRCSGVAGDSSQ